MSRINTNVAALTAQRGLNRSQRSLSDTLQRLSSGLRINRGADDPAGLIASEGLRSEISGISQAIDNSQRASNVIATAEGALNEVAALLLNVKDLIVEAANAGAVSEDEISANQLQIDSAIKSVTRIANTTTFAGLKLINGSLDYITSGLNTSEVTALNVTQANFGTADSIPVAVNVVTSAQTAELQFRASATTGPVTLEVAGTDGVEVLKFGSSTAVADIIAAVNSLSDSLGVEAQFINSANPNSGLTFVSKGYGTRNFVSVEAKSGSFSTVDTTGAARTRDLGQDVVATINGALAVGDGRDVKLNSGSLEVQMTLAESFGTGTTSFSITGGGALFQLGPQVTTNQQVNVAIQSVAASNLGDDEVGYLSDVQTGGFSDLRTDPGRASSIIERAIRQVAIARGRLGAFEKNTLETNVNSLSIALENVTASESSIRDADFAEETARLTRAQILAPAGTSVLATANASPQNVLSLLQ